MANPNFEAGRDHAQAIVELAAQADILVSQFRVLASAMNQNEEALWRALTLSGRAPGAPPFWTATAGLDGARTNGRAQPRPLSIEVFATKAWPIGDEHHLPLLSQACARALH